MIIKKLFNSTTSLNRFLKQRTNENASWNKIKRREINWSVIKVKDRCLLQSFHRFNSLGNGCASFCSRNLRYVNGLRSHFYGVSSFLVMIKEKVVPKVSITSSIFSILEDFHKGF